MPRMRFPVTVLSKVFGSEQTMLDTFVSVQNDFRDGKAL